MQPSLRYGEFIERLRFRVPLGFLSLILVVIGGSSHAALAAGPVVAVSADTF